MNNIRVKQYNFYKKLNLKNICLLLLTPTNDLAVSIRVGVYQLNLCDRVALQSDLDAHESYSCNGMFSPS